MEACHKSYNMAQVQNLRQVICLNISGISSLSPEKIHVSFVEWVTTLFL
jgi:hypothetical protein